MSLLRQSFQPRRLLQACMILNYETVTRLSPGIFRRLIFKAVTVHPEPCDEAALKCIT